MSGEVVEGEAVHVEQAEEKPVRRRRTVTVPAEMIVAQQAPEEETPNTLVRLAVQQNFDLEKLEKLLQLQRDWQREEARKAFFAALSKFQSELPPIVKQDKADLGRAGKRRYASLGTINEAIRPYLYANGLSFRFRQQQGPDGITVTCIVSHRDGHSEETTLLAGADASGGKNSIQSVGSTVTYLCRYTLVSALGLTTVEDDDDGEQTPAQVRNEASAFELAKAAAAADQASTGADRASPQPPPSAPQPAAEKVAAPMTSQQFGEMVQLMKELFPSGPKASEWLQQKHGTADPRTLTETAAMGVLSDLNLMKHEATKPVPPPPVAESSTGTADTVSMVTQEQRDRIRDLTFKVYGAERAPEENARFIQSLGYGSARSLTAAQAADRIVFLETLCQTVTRGDNSPF